MKLQIVQDGESRLRRSDEHQALLRDLHKAIRAKYEAEWAEAGLFRRLVLQRRMSTEFLRERRKIEPSDQSLFARSPKSRKTLGILIGFFSMSQIVSADVYSGEPYSEALSDLLKIVVPCPSHMSFHPVRRWPGRMFTD